MASLFELIDRLGKYIPSNPFIRAGSWLAYQSFAYSVNGGLSPFEYIQN